MELSTLPGIKLIGAAILILYFLCLVILFLYSLTQFRLARSFVRTVKKPKQTPPKLSHFPHVTVQLPLYNELYVVERLLKSIVALDYPKNKLEIQVLDDSTDESLELTHRIVTEYQKEGFAITHLTRSHREGFKAGALKEGLKTATGEFIVVFDADFIPPPDWLIKTIPHFNDPTVGVVQTRWGHLNKSYSVWTEVQAFALDAHFLLEQVGRNQRGYFINFNGTAGVWRKKCILDSGNWEADTLTEDLDLSYRAQLKQWKFIYLKDVVSPAELPITLNAIRSQQFRWNKGGAENFRKLIHKVLRSKSISLEVKYNAFFHLLNSTMFLFVSLLALLSVPIVAIKSALPEWRPLFYIGSIFIVTTLLFFGSYWQVHRYQYGSGFSSFLHYCKRFILFYSLVMGFSIHNAIAVLEGLLGKKSPFVRTPKFNVEQTRKKGNNNKYRTSKRSKFTFIELGLSLYFLLGLSSAFWVGPTLEMGMLPFHLLLFFGFSSITYFGFKSQS